MDPDMRTAGLNTGSSIENIFLQVGRTSPVEEVHTPIDLGRACIIPPILKRSTASNISFDRVGEFNLPLKQGTNLFQVKESCNQNLNPLFASHGVSTRPASTVMRNTMKETSTDSLVTPIMEKDLMKEPWIVQNPLITSSNNEEENTVYSIWEENYQDLSDWCMDALQAPCVFLTGESAITEHSGPKIEDKNAPVNLLGVVDKDKGDIQVNKTVEEATDKMEGGKDIANIQMIHKYKIKDEKAQETIDLSDIWLTQQKSSIALRTDEWIKSVDNERINGPLERENWDTINTFDTTASNSFDLLSYLCEDDIQSPDGSVSTDSISVFTANPIEQQCITSREYKNTDQKPETITSSTLSSRSAQQDDSMPSSSLSSSLRKTRGSSKGSMKKIKKEPINEMPYVRSNRGKKRTIESDSDDRMSDCSYRESREKNNEASRKSRLNKKTKENEMMARAGQLEKDNRLLKIKVEELEKMVTSMRAAILRSALMKNNI